MNKEERQKFIDDIKLKKTTNKRHKTTETEEIKKSKFYIIPTRDEK